MDNAREKVSAALHKGYLDGKQPPYSDAYMAYRALLIAGTFADSELMARFAQNATLPRVYGVRVDERCIEYPWVFARLDTRPARVLDAGSTLNYKFLLDHPLWAEKQLHILTLAPEAECFWRRGISYLFEDLRDLPIRDGFYNLVICISTLEHIGFDNCDFTGATELQAKKTRPDDFLLAMREFRRVLKPGGKLLLTVPYGKYRDLGTQQVFDAARLKQAIDAFEPEHVTCQFYAYTASGWQIASEHDCGECEYVNWVALRREQRPTEFSAQPDGAIAARAVACLALTKG